MNDNTPAYLVAFRERAERGRAEIEIAISDTVCDIVDDTIVPALMEDAEHPNLFAITQVYLDDAAKTIMESFGGLVSKWGANERVFGRFQQHINGECADDEETKAALSGLRVDRNYDYFSVVKV